MYVLVRLRTYGISYFCGCTRVSIFTLQLNYGVGRYTGDEGGMMATIGKLSEFVPECESLTA